jgi:dolichol-phosphate mannosyltransferase
MYDKTIIVPAYNEENRIWTILDESRFYPYNYIFVCDGKDHTSEIIQAFKKEFNLKSIDCLVYPKRLGKGGGVIEGIKHTSTPYVGFMDADYSTNLDEMTKLFDVLSHQTNGYNIVIGSRWLPESIITTKQPFTRRLQSRALNKLVKWWFNLDIYDTQCGAKVFRASILPYIITNIKTKGFEFDIEFLWKLQQLGCCIKEIPIEWVDKGNSHVKIACSFKIFKKLFVLKFRLI